MFKHIYRLGLFLVLFSSVSAQPLINLKLGGKQDDVAYSAIQTPLGDYVVAGSSASNNSGSTDMWITRRDKNGAAVWEKYIGGASHDIAYDLIQNKEGKYVVCGFSADEKTGSKAVVACLSPKGEIEWQSSYGGGKGEKAACITQSREGGYVFTGFTRSYSKGQQDAWVVKLDATGKVIWQKSYGGAGTEDGNAIIPSRSGGYIIAGRIEIKGPNDEKPNKSMYIFKIDEAGKEVWNRTIAGDKNEEANAIVELNDGRIAVAGWTASKGMGRTDGEVVMLTKEGNVLWDKTFGKAGLDGFNSLTFTPDENYLIAAGASTPASATESGLWVVKMDLKGNIMWEKTSNGDKDESINSICALTGRDGGFLAAGFSNNESAGGKDMWLVNVSSMGMYKINQPPVAAPTPRPTPPLPPNPNGGGKPDPLKPNLYILAVGVSEYHESKYNLTFAHTDADSVADMFATMKGKMFGKVEVKKLLNDQATLVNIKKGIQWLEEQATQKDLIVMFFSSHGALDNKGNLYILPHDFSPVSLFATGLNIKDITSGTNATPCKKLIFMDACHSGEAGADMLEFAAIKDIGADNLMKEIMDADPGVTIMSSSTGKEFSYEKPSWGHGAFTKAILEGLQGKADYNKDRIVYFSELNNFVSERVKELTKGKQHPFTPINIFGNIPIFSIAP